LKIALPYVQEQCGKHCLRLTPTSLSTIMYNYRVVKETECPSCGCTLNAAVDPNEPTAVPRPGDMTICMSCCKVLIFTEDLGVRLAGPADVKKFTQDTLDYIQRLQRDIERSLK
jgi:hypothetical protein